MRSIECILHPACDYPSSKFSLSPCLSFYLSTYLPIFISMFLCFYVSIYLYIYLSLFLSCVCVCVCVCECVRENSFQRPFEIRNCAHLISATHYSPDFKREMGKRLDSTSVGDPDRQPAWKLVIQSRVRIARSGDTASFFYFSFFPFLFSETGLQFKHAYITKHINIPMAYT